MPFIGIEIGIEIEIETTPNPLIIGIETRFR
jgi:hypothetical protein